MSGGCKEYAQQTLGASKSGVDGCVRGAASSGMGDGRGFAVWIGLSQFSASDTFWAQVGQFQGSNWTFSSSTSRDRIEQYWEVNGFCGYTKGNLGAPSRANQAYYVTVSTTASYARCPDGSYTYGGYQYFHRLGSFTNPPVATGWTTAIAQYQPQAVVEVAVGSGKLYPGINQQKFGLNDSGAQSPSRALHVQQSGSWVIWTTSGTGASTSLIQGPHYFYYGIGGAADYGQFIVND